MTLKTSVIAFVLLVAPAVAIAQSSSSGSTSSGGNTTPLGSISATPLGTCALAGSAQTAVPRKTRCVVAIVVTDSDGNGVPSQKFKFEYRNIGGIKWRKLGEGRTTRRGAGKAILLRVEKSASYRATTDLNGDRRVDALSTPFDIYVQVKTRSDSSSSKSSSPASSSVSSSSAHSENEHQSSSGGTSSLSAGSSSSSDDHNGGGHGGDDRR